MQWTVASLIFCEKMRLHTLASDDKTEASRDIIWNTRFLAKKSVFKEKEGKRLMVLTKTEWMNERIKEQPNGRTN